MLRRLVLVVCVAASLKASSVGISPVRAADLPAGNPREAGLAPEKLDQIRDLLETAVKQKQMSGGITLIARHGKVVHLATAGFRDTEARLPVDSSTIFRIASMTKPITSTAVMILVEEGKLRLDDPISKYLPEFKNPSVLVLNGSGSEPSDSLATLPAERPITIHQLLTHTSGLSYRFANPPKLGPLLVESAISDGLSETPGTIGDNVKRLAKLPLLYQPGTTWHYSLSTDVLGRLVEVASGRTLDQFFREKIFVPLQMNDTSFLIPKDKRDRLATLYSAGSDGTIQRAPTSLIQDGPKVYSGTYSTWDSGFYYSGGAGLASTITDYARFCQMILNRGELDGIRLLKPETIALMTKNQVPGMDVLDWGHGDGFGYGFGVVTEANRYKDISPVGTSSWGGFFHTYFWIDPKNGLVALFMTQLHPAGDIKVRQEFHRLTYEALGN